MGGGPRGCGSDDASQEKRSVVRRRKGSRKGREKKRERERERERERNKHTHIYERLHKLTDRQTDRQTDIQSGTLILRYSSYHMSFPLTASTH